MPEDRLQRTREAYLPVVVSFMPTRCGHRNQIVGEFRVITQPDGHTVQQRLPRRFRVRGPEARYCGECGQVVDATDDREAHNAERL